MLCPVQACDWAAHPAEYILGETSHGKYLVMRSGLGFTEYGLVRRLQPARLSQLKAA